MRELVIRNIGDTVAVLDRKGEFSDRGKIIGRSFMHPMKYDIRTDNGECLQSIPETMLREVASV